ncbi:acid beta-fructofuranosidase-like [Olea europaea var. sylvestris]|uniref:acid beta-fructofuranosidase-like n=1 Tax=Olea europaea var. sylvestris TaxID=158386 RepID=UPI000C1D63C1|nr:acid beta-fructofuranosidase-like [Olea europaea var. sylvestris]
MGRNTWSSPRLAKWKDQFSSHMYMNLIHWLHLPFAMVPDHWYDINGVLTRSATILPDDQIVMLYTGDTYDVVQVQCLAYPANLSDPLLLDWVKYSCNPVLVLPPDIGEKDFRDPTTAWLSPDGDKWQITIGSKVNTTGISLVYDHATRVGYRKSLKNDYEAIMDQMMMNFENVTLRVAPQRSNLRFRGNKLERLPERERCLLDNLWMTQTPSETEEEACISDDNDNEMDPELEETIAEMMDR